jgi:hypothetical protein
MIMKRVICSVLFFCAAGASIAMQQQQLSHVQMASKRAIAQLITAGFNYDTSQRCIDVLNRLVNKLRGDGNQSGVVILTLGHLKSLIYVLTELQEYVVHRSLERKDKLLSISKPYSGNVSELIHSIVD